MIDELKCYGFADNNKRFICIDVDKDKMIEGHEWEMIAYTKPFFLLNVAREINHTQYKYVYDIGNRRCLSSVQGAWNGYQLIHFLKEWARLLELISLYFLSEAHLLIEPDMVYVNEIGKPSFIYLPFDWTEIPFATRLYGLIESLEGVISCEDLKSLGLIRHLLMQMRGQKLERSHLATIMSDAIINFEKGYDLPLESQKRSDEGEKNLGTSQYRNGLESSSMKVNKVIAKETMVTKPTQNKPNEGNQLLSRFLKWGKRNTESNHKGEKTSRKNGEDTKVNYILKTPRGDTIPLDKTPFTIGKENGCDFIIPNNVVSKRHCQLINFEEELFLVDTGSTNGTYIGDEKCETDKMYNLNRFNSFKVGHLMFEVLTHIENEA